MRVHLFTSLALVCGLTSFASAQTFVTSPAGFLTIDGGQPASLGNKQTGSGIRFWTGSSQEFGAFPNDRFQYIDDTHRGKALRIIKSIAMRMDINERAHGSEARTWSNVTIHMGRGIDYTKTTTTFSTNYAATPTQVFSSSVSWPAVSGMPYTTVAPWGAQVSFSLSPNYVQDNSTSTVIDYRFTGGRLAGGSTWDEKSNSNANGGNTTYLLDAAYVDAARVGYNYGAGAGPGCMDSSKTKNCTSYLTLATYAKDALSRANSFNWDAGIFDGANNANYMMVYSTGLVAAIPFPGVTCNGIRVDLSQALLFLPVTTGATGRYRKIQQIPYVPVPPGIQLNVQSAWSDSQTNQVKLTNVSLDEIHQQPPGKIIVVRKKGTLAATRQMNHRATPVARYGF